MDRNASHAAAVRALVEAGLADPEATWSVGGFGALAEFGRRPDEPAHRLGDGRLGLVTARGGIALDDPDAASPVAYETAFTGGWSHAVALCLPVARCPWPGCGVLEEAGPDAGALRRENSGDKLFDLGLDLPQGRVFLRTGDRATLARLRAALGARAFAEGSPVPDLIASRAADFVVSTPLGRVEVFAGVDPASPAPRGFVLARLLALRRSHAATAPIPAGLVPVATLHPAHPCRNADRHPCPFDPARHAAFQALHRRWGDRELVTLKARLVAGEAAPDVVGTRRMRGVARAVRAQADAMAAAANRPPEDRGPAKSRNVTSR